MANVAAVCNTFKTDLLTGKQAFGASVVRGSTVKDSFKFALYLVTATLSKSTTQYSSSGELAGTGNYTQTGTDVTNGTDPSIDSDVGIWTPTGPFAWNNLTSSGAFDAGLLYNNTATGKNSVAVFTFGTQNVTNGNFSLTMPANAAGTALLRVA